MWRGGGEGKDVYVRLYVCLGGGWSVCRGARMRKKTERNRRRKGETKGKRRKEGGRPLREDVGEEMSGD